VLSFLVVSVILVESTVVFTVESTLVVDESVAFVALLLEHAANDNTVQATMLNLMMFFMSFLF